MTLVELLLVVAVIGVLAGLAGLSLSNVVRTGRLNGASSALVRLATQARARAVTERCRYVLQLNGPAYDADAAGAPPEVPRRPATALLYRKGTCGSVVPAFEPAATPADHLVAEYSLDEFRFELEVPPTVLATQRIDTGSLSVSFNPLGQRELAVDPEADGVSSPTPVVTDAVPLGLRPLPFDPSSPPPREVVIPFAGRATAP